MTLPKQPTVEQLLAIVVQLQERIAALEAENAALRELLRKGGPKPPALSDLPHFVKANKPKKEGKEPKERKGRRQRDQGYSRPASSFPTRMVSLAVEKCPDCGRPLSGGWMHSMREVIDILPAVTDVVRCLVMGRRCGVCKKRRLPRSQERREALAAADAADAAALGQHRFVARLASLIAHLKTVGRRSVRTIQRLLHSLFGLTISAGGIVDLLKAVADAGKKTYDTLLSDLRASPFVHADETGWREDGINDYLWSFSTPAIRLFVRDQSRSHDIPERMLGSDFRSILCSDFYSGYHYHLGEHQRCWVHLLRDNHNLKAAFADNAEVQDWCDRLYALYQEATSTCWLRKLAGCVSLLVA
jgi:transposase